MLFPKTLLVLDFLAVLVQTITPANDLNFQLANIISKRTRGEIGYSLLRAQEVGRRSGGPIVEKIIDYAPVEDAAKVPPNCSQLSIIAAEEELFDNRDHGIKAHSLTRGPKQLVTIPGITHCGVYREAREQATELAIEWLDKHLKGTK